MGRQGLNFDNLVYIYEDEVWGILVELGAHFSTISYTHNGNDFEVLVENDDFILFSEMLEQQEGITE